MKKFLWLFLVSILLASCNLRSITDNTQTPVRPNPIIQTGKISHHWEKEVLADNLYVPWDIAVLPNLEILFTERNGKVKKIQQDKKVVQIAEISQSKEIGEGGLTGLTLHPNFPQNHLLYLYYTYQTDGRTFNRISQFEYDVNTLVNEKVIVESLPGGNIHNSGRLRFGPDGKLYILTGDAGDKSTAQNPNSLGGKILRVNDDGSIPSDNPNSQSPIYTLGHRNAQGMDWDPITANLIVTEHGQDAYDEINFIEAGKNYGWPNKQECFANDSKFTDPLFCSQKNRYAPSGAAFFNNKSVGLENAFFVANLRGEKLIKFDYINSKLTNEEIIINDIGRIRAVTPFNGQSLLISTSNRDGRGAIQKSDDKIYKLTPVKD